MKIGDEEYKSKIVMGNLTIFLTKKFNWFNRLMIKLIFGLNIKKVGGENMRKTGLILMFLVIAAILLGLIYKISRLEETNGRLRQIEREYNRICTRYGGNNCE